MYEITTGMIKFTDKTYSLKWSPNDAVVLVLPTYSSEFIRTKLEVDVLKKSAPYKNRY
jgi:phage host-nuclease inhibitor protein Gam